MNEGTPKVYLIIFNSKIYSTLDKIPDSRLIAWANAVLLPFLTPEMKHIRDKARYHFLANAKVGYERLEEWVKKSGYKKEDEDKEGREFGKVGFHRERNIGTLLCSLYFY